MHPAVDDDAGAFGPVVQRGRHHVDGAALVRRPYGGDVPKTWILGQQLLGVLRDLEPDSIKRYSVLFQHEINCVNAALCPFHIQSFFLLNYAFHG